MSSSELDPLVKELTEKKLSFKRNVVSLATELKDVRTRLVAQQQQCAVEVRLRESAESKARAMEEDVLSLQSCLLPRLEDVAAMGRGVEKRIGEMEERRVADLRESEERVKRLEEQVEELKRGLEEREGAQRRLAEEREGVPRNVEEIARLRDEIRILSAHWIGKTKELQSQLEKQRRTDQEMKKKILKLEFCLQDSRSQMRKLQRKGERRDKAVKELRDLITIKQPSNNTGDDEKNNFWESSGFKFMISMSMLALVIITKR